MHNDIVEIKESAFRYSNISTLEIPDSVTTIGQAAFLGSKITSIDIPNSVTNIGTWTFKYCSSLESIHLPNVLTKIGNEMFCDCTSLTSIEIPESVNSIERGAFSGCTNLERIGIYNPNANIDDNTGIKSNNGKTIIYCYKNSTAYTYAVENSINYKFLDDVKSISVRINPNKTTYQKGYEYN